MKLEINKAPPNHLPGPVEVLTFQYFPGLKLKMKNIYTMSRKASKTELKLSMWDFRYRSLGTFLSGNRSR